MAADSSSSASNVNFDTENDAFNDEIYFGDSRDNVQETEIVSIGVSQRWCGTIQARTGCEEGPTLAAALLLTS